MGSRPDRQPTEFVGGLILDVTVAAVKQLREETGAGVMACKSALDQAKGDHDEAVKILRDQGLARAEKSVGRVATQGLVESYLHAGGRIGAMIELNCETDFVGRTPEFKALAHDLAMQVAATSPKYINVDELPPDSEESAEEVCLMAQPFIKDPEQTIEQLILHRIAIVGENIRVRRFARFQIG